ncbi:hypothetical protein PspLS_01622 [Pyricularia sp. CBS 133598]|nr:hypothetical protein PspLS_01622 [Pyricularia sp. CBS 133598]
MASFGDIPISPVVGLVGGCIIGIVIGNLLGPAFYPVFHAVFTSFEAWKSPSPDEAKSEPKVIGPEAPEGYQTPWGEEVPTSGVDSVAYRLCGTCRQLDLGLLGLRVDGTKDFDQTVILGHGLGGVRSGRESCDLCNVIWSSLFETEQEVWEDNFPDETALTLELGSFTPGSTISNQNGPHRLRIKDNEISAENAIYIRTSLPLGICLPDGASLPQGKMMIYTRSNQGPDSSDPCSRILAEQPLTPPDSSRAMDTINSWLQHCLREHTTCRTTGFDKVRTWVPPPRLIEIDSEKNFRLVDSTNVQKPYAALSYCWGNYLSADSDQTKPVMTTSATFVQFQKQLQLNTLPLTIQHAINITYKLGIKYLWVDSICIIQGDPADWKKHTILMGSIYANAVITIAATGAASSSEGCFLSNPKADGGAQSLYKQEARLPLVISGRYIGDMFAAPIWDVGSPKGMDDLRTELENSRWNRRAWVLQERFFSKRVVHFGTFQIHWECQEKIASQMRPFPKGGTLSYKGTKPVFSMEQWWSRLLQQYTDLELSVDGDRFPAIASIAKEISETHQLTYVAGVYTETLPRCLVWAGAATGSYASEDYDKPRLFEVLLGEPKPLLPPDVDPSQRASSWSWAHWEGPIAMSSINKLSKFITHMGGIRVVERGDEHSRHQSLLVFWSQIRRVTRRRQRMKASELAAEGFAKFQPLFECHRSQAWPWNSVCHAIFDGNQDRSSHLGNGGFVVFDDPVNAAPLEFDLIPIGSLYTYNFVGEGTKHGYLRLDMSLAAELVEDDVDSAANLARQSQIPGERGATLMPKRYRRLGLVVQVRWRVPEDNFWEFLTCGPVLVFAELSPYINRMMRRLPFGLFKWFHTYKQVCLI